MGFFNLEALKSHPFKPLVDWKFLFHRDANPESPGEYGPTNLTKLAMYEPLKWAADKIRMTHVVGGRRVPRAPANYGELLYFGATELSYSWLQNKLRATWRDAVPGLLAFIGAGEGASDIVAEYTVKVQNPAGEWKEIPIYAQTVDNTGPPFINNRLPTPNEIEDGIRYAVINGESPINDNTHAAFNEVFVNKRVADHTWNGDFGRFSRNPEKPKRWSVKEEMYFIREQGARTAEHVIPVAITPGAAPVNYTVRIYERPTANNTRWHYVKEAFGYWLWDTPFNLIHLKEGDAHYQENFATDERKDYFKVSRMFNRNPTRLDADFAFDM